MENKTQFTFIVLCLIIQSCSNHLRHEKLRKLELTYMIWKKDKCGCVGERYKMAKASDTLIIGRKLNYLEIDSIELITIFGTPDSIINGSDQNIYKYFINPVCDDVKNVIYKELGYCFYDMIIDKKKKTLQGVSKMCI